MMQKPTGVMTREQAVVVFRDLVRRHGLQWTAASVPEREPWDRMAEVNKILSEDDRRQALGLPNRNSRSAFRPGGA